MPFSRPTLTELRTQVQQDLSADPAVGTALLRFSNTRVLGRIQADLAHLHYGFLDWISRQAVPFTCSDEFLEAWASLKNILRKAAAAATGTVAFTGSTDGVVVPSGTEVIRADGVTYHSTANATVSGGTANVPVAADTPAAASDASTGTVMTLGAAIATIQVSGTVASPGLTGGADVESDDDLRTRMLEAFQNPPQGGAKSDYVEWALAVAGVTRAWPLPNAMGVGTVTVYFMMDETEAAHGGFPQGTNGVASAETRSTPATGDQLAVANYIYGLQPVTALVYAVAPTASPVNFTIHNVAAAQQAAVQAAIADVFLREGSPGGVILPDGTAGGTVDLEDIWTAIAAVPGVKDFLIISPTADIVMTAGNLPTVGTITWT